MPVKLFRNNKRYVLLGDRQRMLNLSKLGYRYTTKKDLCTTGILVKEPYYVDFAGNICVSNRNGEHVIISHDKACLFRLVREDK